MATSGSAGNSKQKEKGSLAQNEQRTMDHSLLLNAAWQVHTDSVYQAHKTTRTGRTIPTTVRFPSTTAHKWT